MINIESSHIRRKNAGASLIVVLLMLVIITTLGIAASQLSLLNEKGSRNDRDREIAFQAAEAALVDAELDIFGPNTFAGKRCAIFDRKSAEGFSDGCGTSGIYRGLCTPAAPGQQPAWLQVDFTNQSAAAPSVAYGTFTNQSYPTGHGVYPTRVPRYVIELFPDYGGMKAAELRSVKSNSLTYIYRITAIGFGIRDETQVVLQTVFTKRVNANGC
jgi:type IV pilus assembly protein PilX